MTNTSSSSEHFSLVASFYGPGNIISWLCTVASVFITWCLNRQYRRKDSISVDFIFALVVPGVAVGHVIYMMFFSGDAEHESVQQLFTSSDFHRLCSV
jgi:ABC-type spermidine/putrescine transport system permease subunit II